MRYILILAITVCLSACATVEPEWQMPDYKAYQAMLEQRYSGPDAEKNIKEDRNKHVSKPTMTIYQTDSLGNIQYHKPTTTIVIKK